MSRTDAPIRAAVASLVGGFGRSTAPSIFNRLIYGPGSQVEPAAVRMSWFVIAATLTHAITRGASRALKIESAYTDFIGDRTPTNFLTNCFTRCALDQAQDEIGKVEIGPDLVDLLPYALEPHGHVSRSRHESSIEGKDVRSRKRQHGVYYTPTDVADFMVASLDSCGETDGTWLDPACGTGVFLRSVLARRKVRHAIVKTTEALDILTGCIFGIDKSALALDLCAHVLLVECVDELPSSMPLFEIWKRIRHNLVCMDALLLSPPGGVAQRQLLEGGAQKFVEIHHAFPSYCAEGFDHVVMNPPYSKVKVLPNSERPWLGLGRSRIGRSVDAQIPFTDLLVRLTSRQGNSGAVLPLGIGSNTSKEYVALRSALIALEGTKEFLFFDREPQALFGEDIKTRNTIFFRMPTAQRQVRTSRLLKWTAEQRPTVLTRERLVQISADACLSFVPKVGSHDEVLAYARLASRRAEVSTRVIRRITLAAAVESPQHLRKTTVLVGSTAYNFLNCFFPVALPEKTPRPYSDSPLHALESPTQADAFATYALISSRIAFWLWHVEGDGFHVTAEFLKRLPGWDLLECESNRMYLAIRGEAMWRIAQASYVGAVNGGKQTYSYSFNHKHQIAIEIEEMLVRELDLQRNFTRAIDSFLDATISVNGKRRTRH